MRFCEGDIVKLIYIDRAGRLTERFVRVLSISNDLLVAYCYYRKAPRSFARSNILAAEVRHHGRTAV
ncbi:MAG TPA: hypothetical protein VFK33_11775 [Bacillales bacterium]|nr:hypothetical protein [Bacillales bacterium]